MITDTQLMEAFSALRTALEAPGCYHLPVDARNRRYRAAKANEFMLMDVCDGVACFKHCATRNYLYLYPKNRLVIPCDDKDAFFGGFYGEGGTC